RPRGSLRILDNDFEAAFRSPVLRHRVDLDRRQQIRVWRLIAEDLGHIRRSGSARDPPEQPLLIGARTNAVTIGISRAERSGIEYSQQHLDHALDAALDAPLFTELLIEL